jgi:hypothetical protein
MGRCIPHFARCNENRGFYFVSLSAAAWVLRTNRRWRRQFGSQTFIQIPVFSQNKVYLAKIPPGQPRSAAPNCKVGNAHLGQSAPQILLRRLRHSATLRPPFRLGSLSLFRLPRLDECTMRRLRFALGIGTLSATLAAALSGCAMGPTVPSPGATLLTPPPPVVQPGAPSPVPPLQYVPPFESNLPPGPITNPLHVPVADRDMAWEQLIAVIEEYFKVEHEERVRLAGDILTEGRIDTYPQTGATLMEPWRGDSVTYYDKLESTLQSIRRRAFVRVIPDQTGFLIDLTVLKELENLPQPMRSSAGSAAFQKDVTLDRSSEPLPSLNQPPATAGRPGPPGPPPSTWIPEGRDPHLEQVILAKIQARMTQIAAPAFTSPGGVYGLPPTN